MNYHEEQSGEIEALESIYYGDLKIITSEPNYKFGIPIKSEGYDSDSDLGLLVTLLFTYTSKYPDEVPGIEIEDSINLSDEIQEDLIRHLKEQAKENVGMVMVFTLVSAAQEWLNLKWDEVKLREEEEKQRVLKEIEEAEQKKFEGTKVTVETFLKWKQQFEEDTGIKKRRETTERDGRKMTGRELFMTDKTLNESDLQFLEGEEVKVDESLFQDLDDLDIDDEDDPDYDPNNSLSDSA